MRNEILESGQLLLLDPDDNDFKVCVTLIRRILEPTATKDIWEVILDNGATYLLNLIKVTYVV